MTTVAADAAVLERTVGRDAIFVVVSGQTGSLPGPVNGALIGPIRDLDMDGVSKAVAAQRERAA